jgi:hypothetical protein
MLAECLSKVKIKLLMLLTNVEAWLHTLGLFLGHPVFRAFSVGAAEV